MECESQAEVGRGPDENAVIVWRFLPLVLECESQAEVGRGPVQNVVVSIRYPLTKLKELEEIWNAMHCGGCGRRPKCTVADNFYAPQTKFFRATLLEEAITKGCLLRMRAAQSASALNLLVSQVGQQYRNLLRSKQIGDPSDAPLLHVVLVVLLVPMGAPREVVRGTVGSPMDLGFGISGEHLQFTLGVMKNLLGRVLTIITLILKRLNYERGLTCVCTLRPGDLW